VNLRPYQSEAIDAVNAHLADTDSHSVVAIPTAGGKTVIFATMIADWLKAWPETRVCILAHRQELLTQAEAKIKMVWPEAPVSVWSAGLKRYEAQKSIVIAGIQSVYKRACEFDPFDIIIIDEAHLVPNTSDTMYRRFLKDAKLCNPHVRYVGWTATPYRLDGGDLCGPGKLFDEVCYEADIASLIDDKYLCPLRTKATVTKLDTAGIHTRQGDFIQSEMESKFNTDHLVQAACAEIIRKGEDRKAWLVFTCGVSHAFSVASELTARGVPSRVVVGDTDKEDRAQILADFDAGRLKCVVNVNCLTTGLDITRIDLIAVLRPTESTSLWVQMVGRGFRLHPDKQDCLILDFGQNALRHGPLNALRIKRKGDGAGGAAPAKTCPECEEIIAAASRVCPCCGYEFPARELKHEKEASNAPILTTSEPWEVPVVSVDVAKHERAGKPPSLRVTYRGELEQHREWVCFEHDGYARRKAEMWWRRRFPDQPVPATVDEALGNIFLGQLLTQFTSSIRVKQEGRYTSVISVQLREENSYGAIAS
jgi:DNA repair protein RadD